MSKYKTVLVDDVNPGDHINVCGTKYRVVFTGFITIPEDRIMLGAYPVGGNPVDYISMRMTPNTAVQIYKK